MNTIPFTYLIGWKNLNKYYYGVKYANGCNPADLWTTYFTSSKIVKEYRQKYGEPDIIQVRKTFTNKEYALEWEYRFLTKVNALKSDKWLNENIRGEKFSNISGIARSEKCRKKISERRKQYLENRTEEQKERDYRVQQIASKKRGDKISVKAKERFNDPEFYKKHIDSHNTDEYKKLISELTTNRMNDEAFKQEWLAIMQSDEYREKQSKTSLEIWSDENKRKEQSERMKALITDDYKKQMSLNAKKSTGDRMATRYMNKLSDDEIINHDNITIVQYIKFINKYEFDKAKLIKKFMKKQSEIKRKF